MMLSNVAILGWVALVAVIVGFFFQFLVYFILYLCILYFLYKLPWGSQWLREGGVINTLLREAKDLKISFNSLSTVFMQAYN